MGALAPGSAHARPSAQPPIDTSGNFSGGAKKIDLKTPCKISEPYDNSFWEKSNNLGKKEQEKKKAVNSGHLVPWQRTQAARANI